MSFLKGFLVLSIALSAVAAQAASQPRLFNEAKKVKEEISKDIFSMNGVNGIGLTACDTRSGEMDLKGGVFCVEIMTETKAAAARVEQVYPSGEKVDGIYVWVQVIGEIKPQPRMSGGSR